MGLKVVGSKNRYLLGVGVVLDAALLEVMLMLVLMVGRFSWLYRRAEVACCCISAIEGVIVGRASAVCDDGPTVVESML